MTPEQEQHLAEIKARFAAKVSVKYRKGVEEHGGNLWDNEAKTLLDFAIDEAIDQVVYLFTLKDKLREIGVALNNLQSREEHQ